MGWMIMWVLNVESEKMVSADLVRICERLVGLVPSCTVRL